jgi:cytochrome b6-f complex iron-sulfur subunit
MTSKTQSRREFCTGICQAASLAAIAAALPGCGSGGSPTSPGFPSGISSLPTVAGDESSGIVTVAVGASSPLATAGNAAIVQTQFRYLLVARTGQDSFTALTAICTHQTCTINGYASQTYVCPCHGSRFDLNGQVLGGPAPFPLAQYRTQFANDQLTITL